MKSITAAILTIFIAIFSAFKVNAQAPETIWLTGDLTAYKTGETVVVHVNAISATPIQGFNFQIRYDPACLTPVTATSPIAGMNGLFLPQNSGLVDASFASTTPQSANGILAEVRFTTLGGCQTDLTLEKADLAIRSETGLAVALTGITLGTNKLTLAIDSAQGSAQELPAVSGAPLSLAPNTIAATPTPSLPKGTVGLVGVLGVILLIGAFILFRQLRSAHNSQK
ncbi:MAG: hypothetical protein IT310_04870 [Anaerolineales bacterium]|nr:hypothetical protein [Anaerolineales bacterium]